MKKLKVSGLINNIKKVYSNFINLEVELTSDDQLDYLKNDSAIAEILSDKPTFLVNKTEWNSEEVLPHLTVIAGKRAGTEVRINRKYLKEKT